MRKLKYFLILMTILGIAVMIKLLWFFKWVLLAAAVLYVSYKVHTTYVKLKDRWQARKKKWGWV